MPKNGTCTAHAFFCHVIFGVSQISGHTKKNMFNDVLQTLIQIKYSFAVWVLWTSVHWSIYLNSDCFLLLAYTQHLPKWMLIDVDIHVDSFEQSPSTGSCPSKLRLTIMKPCKSSTIFHSWPLGWGMAGQNWELPAFCSATRLRSHSGTCKSGRGSIHIAVFQVLH